MGGHGQHLPAVTDDDLGAVLVGHDYGWAGKSAPVRVRVVWLQRLLSHTCMQIVSHFEHIPVDRNDSEPVVKAFKKKLNSVKKKGHTASLER